MLLGFFRLRCLCGSTQLRRSARRTPVENFCSFLMLPWRCENCTRRSYKASWLRFAKPAVPPPPSPMRRNRLDQMIAHAAQAFDRGTGASDLD